MKLIGTSAVLLVLAFASCHKPTAENTEPESPAVTPSPATPPPARPQAAAPTPAVIVRATPAPELAPPGIFYLVQNVRIETDSGVTGLPPGTGVKLVREGVYLTPAGEVSLRPEQITNDLAVARQARDADRAAQAALTARAAKMSAATAASAPRATTVPGGQDTGQFDKAVKQMEHEQVAARVAAMQQQAQALRDQVAALTARKSKEDYDRISKGRMVTSSTAADLTAAQAALNNLQAQIAALQAQH